MIEPQKKLHPQTVAPNAVCFRSDRHQEYEDTALNFAHCHQEAALDVLADMAMFVKVPVIPSEGFRVTPDLGARTGGGCQIIRASC